MNKIFMLLGALSFGACNLGGSSSPAPAPVVHAPGVFHQGPYTDPSSGKSCSAPGGYCESDGQCHSDASKCIIQ